MYALVHVRVSVRVDVYVYAMRRLLFHRPDRRVERDGLVFEFLSCT